MLAKASSETVEARFEQSLRSGAMKQRVANLPKVGNSLTNAMEQAALVELIHLLAPTDLLEIGTYFAGTTRTFAQEIAKTGGSVVTIDPLGGERVPPILASWPNKEQAVTTFFPMNSMTYFFSLHVQNRAMGSKAPFNLIYVDGNHAYQYASFDLLSAAVYLRPRGAIVVDNINAAGVRIAVETFLAQRSHWRLYDDCSAHRLPLESIAGCAGAILFAPPGVEVGQIPIRLSQRGIAVDTVGAITIPLLPVGARGNLEVSANLFFTSRDNQKTGAGMVNATANLTVPVKNDSKPLTVHFDQPLHVARTSPGHTTIEIELWFRPDGASPNILLHEDCKIDLL